MNSRRAALILTTALLAFFIAWFNQSTEACIAFVNVNLIPMTIEEVVEDQTVLVEGSKIIAVGSSEAIEIPEGTRIIDGRGAFLLPGLADMHMHTRQDWGDRDIWPVDPLKLYLAKGVTTIRDFKSSFRTEKRWQPSIFSFERNLK